MTLEQSAKLQKFALAVANLIHEHGLYGRVTVAMGFMADDGSAYCKQVCDGGVDFVLKEPTAQEASQ